MIGRRLVLALVCGAAWFATASSAQTNHVIDVINPMNFDPPEVTIQVGDTVTFQKGNTSPGHNVRSDGFTQRAWPHRCSSQPVFAAAPSLPVRSP